MSNVLHDTPPSILQKILTIGIKVSKIVIKFENPRNVFFKIRYFHMVVIAGETAAPNSLTSFTQGDKN